MGAPFPAVTLANLLSLPARLFAVVQPDSRSTRILVARVARGRPRIVQSLAVDAAEETLADPDEIHEEVRRRLREIAPEAIVVVLPQHRLLRHVLDVPPSDAAQTRALVEREASHIGGLSESSWAHDSARLRPFAGHAHPLAAAFCRQTDLREILDSSVEDEELLFDVLPAGDALAAAFRAVAPAHRDAILIDLGAEHTGVTLLIDGQAVFSASFPSGSLSLAGAAGPRPAPGEAPGPPPAAGWPGLAGWLAELERTLHEWCEDHPALASAAQRSPAFLAGRETAAGALADLAEQLNRRGPRAYALWPRRSSRFADVTSETAAAWGALLASVGLADPIPSFLPRPRRDFWIQQRFWRGLLSADLALVVILAFIMASAIQHQRQVLDGKAEWKQRATRTLAEAREIRTLSESFNARQDALRPIFERQRQTVETLEVLAALQRQRTNDTHWYVLLGDRLSYAAGSNHFAALAPPAPPRSAEPRPGSPPPASTNAPATPDRSFVAEVCLLPQGEKMRQALSELVADLKRFPLFRNVDILPAERRRAWVATNLVFPERHFALELNLSEAELLPPLPLPRLAVTNREPRNSFRSPLRPGPDSTPNGTNAGPGHDGTPNRNGRAR